MINVTFVCLGNICRSPMAEFVFKRMIKDRGVEKSFFVTSCGTSDYEEGNGIYPPAKRTLLKHGISAEHRSRPMTKSDVINSDFVLVMDSSNLFDVLRITGGAFGEKVYKLCSFTENPRDVADPWYTRDFDKAYEDIADGCEGFLNFVLKEREKEIDYDKRH